MRIVKLFLQLGFAFFILTGFAQAIASDQISIQKMNQREVNKQLHTTIEIHYPLIKNNSNSDALNKLIKQIIDDSVKDFKNNISNDETVKELSHLPLNENSNTLTINYQIRNSSMNLLSIRFSFDTYFYGAAHPLTTFSSLNYDIEQGKQLSLADLFNSPDYLTFLSDYSKKVLTEKLSKEAADKVEPIADGINPVSKNYAIWNLTPKGLLITFPPYQVAAYAFGPQEVLIPNDVLFRRLNKRYTH